MNRNMIIFTVIAVPVALVLIGGIILIYFCINTCPSGRWCVPLDKDDEPVGDKVYPGGTHLISPVLHFSPGLPSKDEPMDVHVYTAGDVIDDVYGGFPGLASYTVFRFYVEEDKVYEYFDSLENNYTSSDTDVVDAIMSNISRVVSDVMPLWNCSDYNKGVTDLEARKEMRDKIVKECIKRFKDENMLFSLDEDEPVYTMVFLEGCSYPYYD